MNMLTTIEIQGKALFNPMGALFYQKEGIHQ